MLLHSPLGIHILQWLVSSLALVLTSKFLKGFEISNYFSALTATFVIVLVEYTLGVALFVVTLPLTVLTMGFFLIIIGGIVLRVSAWILPGFSIKSWGSAFMGAVVLAVLNSFLHFFII